MNYSKLETKFIFDFFNLVNKAENIGIAGHKSPDDDSIASVLAVYSLLKNKYPRKTVKIIQTGEKLNKYESFKHFNKIDFVPDITKCLKNIDLLILLDGNEYCRFTRKVKKLKAFSGKTICIDHHSTPPENFDLSLIIPGIPSCAEIIYLLFYQNSKINKPLSEILMLGILGDTGNFAYLRPDQSNTLIIAKRLMEAGKIEIQEFQSRYQPISKNVLPIVQQLLKNTSFYKIKGWPNFQAAFVTRDFAQKKDGDEVREASDLYTTHYLRRIKSYRWGFVITPRTNGACRISLRSLPKSVNVGDIMKRMGIGGGHDHAAGGTFPAKNKKARSVSSCFNDMLDWIKKHKPVIS